jgi:CRP/FNR family nitrogen fixation transcriptional regulator
MLTQTAVRTSVPLTRSVPPVAARALSASEREPLAQTMHLMGVVMSYPRNTEIFGENEAADYLYKVVSGGVARTRSSATGADRSADFICPATFSVSNLPTSTPARPKRSPTRKCW